VSLPGPRRSLAAARAGSTVQGPGPFLLPPEQARRLEQALRGGLRHGLAEFLWKLRRRQTVDDDARAAEAEARALGLLSSAEAPLSVTPVGALFSDSLTEYELWKARGRCHHGARELAALAPERLRDRRVLEVGCGAGVNLLALQREAEVVGVDLEPLYLQLGGLLARVEGLELPARLCARAEALPFADATFDVVLFPGSLPYMRLASALGEAARVLAPGGRVIVIQSDLDQMLRLRLGQGRWRRSPGGLLRELRALAGMAAYPLCGRGLLPRAAPVHLSARRMEDLLARVGLSVVREHSVRQGDEHCYVADKRARSAGTRPSGPGWTNLGMAPELVRPQPPGMCSTRGEESTR